MKLSLLFILISSYHFCFTQKVHVFERGIINKPNEWNFTPTFSKDGNTLVYARWTNPDYRKGDKSIQQLYISKKIEGNWQEPTLIKETSGNRVDWPHYSPDGKYFLLSYNKYHSGQYNFPNEDKWDDFDIWIATCDENGNIDWDTFRPIDSGDINRLKTPTINNIRYVHNETSPRMDLSGNLYFWSERLEQGVGRRDIYVAQPDVNQPMTWIQTELLPPPINSPSRESGVCIDPNGRWLVFSSRRPSGIGGEDLYISFLLSNGKWNTPINLGPQINSDYNEVNPSYNPTENRIYFTSDRPLEGMNQLFPGEGKAVSSTILYVEIESIMSNSKTDK